MGTKIVEAADLPEEEKVYLKKDWLGWRVVEPWKKPDGSSNWFNLITGGKRNLVHVLFIILLAGLFYIGVNELVSNYKAIAESPCEYCSSCFDVGAGSLTKQNNPEWAEQIAALNITPKEAQEDG